MQTLLTSYKSQALFVIALWQIGMTFSMEFLLSLTMIALIALSLFELERKKLPGSFRLKWRSSLKENAKAFLSNKAYLAVMIPFFLVLFSCVYSTDVNYMLERLRIKLPFLVLPFAFFSMPNFDKKDLQKVFFFQLIITFIAALGVGVNYVLNFNEIIDGMFRGGVVPTPGNHIRFSLITALSIIGGASLYWNRFKWKFSWERPLILLMTVLLFVFIHVLSVRSGLLVLYVTIVFLLLRYIFFYRRYVIGFIAILMLLLLPVIAYYIVPSFKAKIAYMQYDIKMYLSGKGANYSDSERLISLQVGMEIGNENKLLGVGAGDLRKVTKECYATKYTDVNMRMPHNQLITVYAGTGIIGLILFLIGFFYPLIGGRRFTDALFLSIHLIIFLSFMMESTIENAVGISFYLLYLLVLLRYLCPRANRKSNYVIE